VPQFVQLHRFESTLVKVAMRVGMIGLGTIARGVLELLQPSDNVELVGAVVAHPDKPRSACSVRVCRTAEELLHLEPEVVVELAGHAALRCWGPSVLRAGIDLLMLSVGVMAEPEAEHALLEAAATGGAQAVVLSGGIGGLDAIASARAGGLTRVTHTARKPARTLLPPEDAAELRGPRELFCGSVRQGALLFPESINVAAAVALAGIGLDRTQVCVVADPAVDRNRHEVIAEGEFGQLRFEIANVPSEGNPKTGKLVAMSVVHALRQRRAGLVIG
jgi:aspartate dehydrogenase